MTRHFEMGPRHVMFVAIALSLVTLARPLQAQFAYLPVIYEPFRTPAGVDWGAGLITGRGGDNGSAKTWSVVGMARRRFAGSVSVAVAGGVLFPPDAGGERQTRGQVGGWVDVLALRRPITISVLGGLGYSSLADAASELSVPIGAGFAYHIGFGPQGAGPKLVLWALPRLDIRRREVGSAAVTQAGPGASGGAAIDAGRLGLNFAADWRRVSEHSSDPTSFPEATRWSFGLLVRMRFRGGT